MLDRAIAKRFQRRATAVLRPPGRPALWLLGVLALFAPPPVAADEIPFFVTNNYTDICFHCGGPWFRVSACPSVPRVEIPGQPPVNFYNAEINLFSPFGTWVCAPTPNCGDCLPASALDRGAVSFCVDAEPNRIDPVELTIDEDGNTSVQGFSAPPCASAAAGGFLGDDSSAGPDGDGFRFKGEAGEKITVTLAPSRSGGGSGKTARLVLRDGGGRRLAADAGALPLKLTATLPAAGNYVVAAIKEAGTGTPFRGHYVVTVRSNAGKARGESLVLGATEQTEP